MNYSNKTLSVHAANIDLYPYFRVPNFYTTAMKILVCISKAPDTTSKIAFADNNTKFDENGVQFIVNPYDEWYALVRALEIKETAGGNVTILSVGGADYEPIIRKALAIGADDAVRIDAAESDSLYVAKQIAHYAKDKGFDIIFCGKETINYNGSVVPGMVAELLDLPYVAWRINLMSLEIQLPSCVKFLVARKWLKSIRLSWLVLQKEWLTTHSNMRGIMAARTKPLAVEAAAAADASTGVKSYSLPPAKSGCKYIAPENAGDTIREFFTKKPKHSDPSFNSIRNKKIQIRCQFWFTPIITKANSRKVLLKP